MAKTLTTQIQAFIEQRYQDKREAVEKEHQKALQNAVTAEDAQQVAQTFAAKHEKDAKDYELPNWLDSAAERASQISMATHVLKFSNSSAKGSSLIAIDLGQDSRYLDTAALKSPALDTTDNAALNYLGKLLMLPDDDGTTLLDYIKQGDTAPLAPFTKNTAQLNQWQEGLKAALQDAKPSSHTLGKQVYFPIAEGEYHLLAPLHSSSLSEAIYQRVQFSRYSQEMKAAREARKRHLPHPEPVVAYPNLALTISGGSKPQNVSQLNSGRGGRNYLFSSCPPKWQAQTKVPISGRNIFTHPELRRETQATIKVLTAFIIKLNQQPTDSRLAIRNRVSQLVDEVIDHIFTLVTQWQLLPSGWSDEALNLPQSQRRWLDPDNPQWDRHDDQWQQEVAKAFALWLVANINYVADDKLTLGQAEVEVWQESFKQALREIS